MFGVEWNILFFNEIFASIRRWVALYSLAKKRMYAKFVTLSICKLLKLLVSIFPFRKLKDCIRTNTLEWMAHVTVATASPPPPPTIDHDIGNRRLNLIYFDRKRVCVCFSFFWLDLLLLATFSLFSEPLIFEGRITECCVFAERKKAAKRPDRHEKKLYVNTFTRITCKCAKMENGKRNAATWCEFDEFSMVFCVCVIHIQAIETHKCHVWMSRATIDTQFYQ